MKVAAVNGEAREEPEAESQFVFEAPAGPVAMNP